MSANGLMPDPETDRLSHRTVVVVKVRGGCDQTALIAPALAHGEGFSPPTSRDAHLRARRKSPEFVDVAEGEFRMSEKLLFALLGWTAQPWGLSVDPSPF